MYSCLWEVHSYPGENGKGFGWFLWDTQPASFTFLNSRADD